MFTCYSKGHSETSASDILTSEPHQQTTEARIVLCSRVESHFDVKRAGLQEKMIMYKLDHSDL